MIREKALTDPPGTVIRLNTNSPNVVSAAREPNPSVMLTNRPHNYRLAAAAKASISVPSGRWFTLCAVRQGTVELCEMTQKIGLDSGTGRLL